MLDQNIKKSFDNLSPEYKDFLASELPKVIANTFAEYYSFDQTREVVLGNAIALLLLFQLDEEGFTTFVSLECNIEPDECKSLYQGIILALPETIRTKFLQTTETLTKLRTNPISVNNEIAETEALLNTIDQGRNVRTMPAGAGSASAETVYTSTQSAILEEGRMRSVNTPTTSGGTAPRWDSAK